MEEQTYDKVFHHEETLIKPSFFDPIQDIFGSNSSLHLNITGIECK